MYVIAQYAFRKTSIIAANYPPDPCSPAAELFHGIPIKAMDDKIFSSYWQAGYEGADHINGAGLPLSMNDITRHGMLAYDDYLLLNDFGIQTVRESVGWRLVEKD
jgi:hypothetical protein